MPLRATVHVMLKHFICVFNVHTFFSYVFSYLSTLFIIGLLNFQRSRYVDTLNITSKLVLVAMTVVIS